MLSLEQIAQALALEYVRKHTDADTEPYKYANIYKIAYEGILSQLKANPPSP